jgi:hypothetical protein
MEDGKMKHHAAVSSTAAIAHPARIGALAMLAVLIVSSSPAGALPPASGSKCKADWVNNAGAMACFVQGEDDVRNGAKHPHYVACTAAGEIFCCVDNDHGGQDCDAVMAGGRQPSDAVKLGAILNAQMSILSTLGQLSTKVDGIESKLGELSRKSGR